MDRSREHVVFIANLTPYTSYINYKVIALRGKGRGAHYVLV